MIVDCHTHIWETTEQLGSDSAAYLRRQIGKANLSANTSEHLAASACVSKTFVLGFTSEFVGADLPNEAIADYVNHNPDKMIGFAGLDPRRRDVMDRLRQIAEMPAFRGITLSPASQDFHPNDTSVHRVYDFCAQHQLAILVHQGTHYWRGAKMEFARPYLWDEVLREYSTLHMVIAHLGHPWIDETLTLLGKHPHLYADLAGLIRRPWHAYNALVQAHQYAVTDKLLFGSDFPFFSASEAIESIYRLNEVTHGTRLPAVPREALRGIIERNALKVLGIERPEDRPADEEAEAEVDSSF